mgnify:CR=1 FL=1
MQGSRFEATLQYRHVKQHIGMFPTLDEAAHARDRLGLQLFGAEFIERCHFPEEAPAILEEIASGTFRGTQPAPPVLMRGDADTSPGRSRSRTRPGGAAGGDAVAAAGVPPAADAPPGGADSLTDAAGRTVRGVRATSANSWEARVSNNGQRVSGGVYASVEEAAAAHDRLLYRLRGSECAYPPCAAAVCSQPPPPSTPSTP